MRISRVHAIATMVCGLVLSSPALPDSHVHPETGELLSEDQTFTYRVLDEFTSIDPQLVEDVSGSEVVRDLFEGLLNQDADGALVPGVATGFSANDSKDIYRFTLRDDARWSDGSPVTANDFVYAWRRAVDPALASPYAWYMELMAIENAAAIIGGEMPVESLGVAALDEQTLEVRLTHPLPYFPQMVVHATTFPAPHWTIELHGTAWVRPENIVSNGAYVLTEHVPGERSVRERNALYWNDESSIIDKTVALVINDENSALIRWQAGELDRTEVPSGQFPRLSQEYPGEAISFPRLCNYYYTFNLSDSGPEPFQDVRVRRALSLAVDRRIITEIVLAGGQLEAYVFTPPATAGFVPPDVQMERISQSERDVRAGKLMAEAGFGPENPLRFKLIYNTSESHKKIAVALSQMWKQKLGVETELGNMEWKTFLEARGNQEFELARGAWCGDYNEASTFLDLLTSASPYNDGKYVSAEIDALMQAAKTAVDPQAIYTRVEEIIAEEQPVIPVYHYAGVYMLDKGVGGWPVQNVAQNWYSRDLYKKAE